MQWSCLPVHSIFALEIKQNHFSFSVIGKFDLTGGVAERRGDRAGGSGGLTNDNNNFPSLSSEEEGGYHLDTPPTVSLVSDIQPCGIEIEVKSEPGSLSSSSEKMVVSQTKSLSSASSDYKCLTESKSLEKNVLQVVDNLGADSSTDDQMSSGTFSQDEISPRFADLPPQLNVEKRRSLSTSELIRDPEPHTQPARRSSSIKDKTLSMEARSTSMASDGSDQEIPPTTPRSDPTASPESDGQARFVYDGDNEEKPNLGSEESEMSSESQLSTTQTTQQTISSCEDSKVTKLVTEESTSVFESVIKMSENVTANILEETKTITKSTKMEVEESVVSSCSDKSEEMMVKATDSTDQVSLTVVSTESSVVTSLTKTDSRTYSDVLKSDKYSESKQAATATTTVDSDRKRSIGAEAASEVLKTETVLQMVGSSSADEKSKKLSYSDVVKSDSSVGKPEEKEPEDPIADWGKPLGLPSPIRPSTPAKQQKRNNEEPVDTNKVRSEV